MLVEQLGNQRELLFDLLQNLRRSTFRPTLCYPFQTQGAQPAAGTMPDRHQFMRVFVAQLLQRKAAQRGNFH